MVKSSNFLNHYLTTPLAQPLADETRLFFSCLPTRRFASSRSVALNQATVEQIVFYRP
jgi:hypothetical protein